jgi:hypothetical protein
LNKDGKSSHLVSPSFLDVHNPPGIDSVKLTVVIFIFQSPVPYESCWSYGGLLTYLRGIKLDNPPSISQ